MKNTSFGKEISRSFSTGNVLVQLIIVNLAVFLSVMVFRLVLAAVFRGNDVMVAQSFNNVMEWVRMPLSLDEIWYKPHTLITTMFLHEQVLHFLFNMLSLYVFGRLFSEFLGPRRLLPVYVYSGISGALLTLACYQFLTDTSLFSAAPYLLGASASVMGIIIAVAWLYPELPLNLLFFGQVKLKYVALIYVILDIASIAYNENLGGHVAHIGGMLFGMVYAIRFRKGKDMATGFNNGIGRVKNLLGVKRSRMVVQHARAVSDETFNARKKERELTLDEILDKINSKGLDSLTKKERSLLEKYSKH